MEDDEQDGDLLARWQDRFVCRAIGDVEDHGKRGKLLTAKFPHSRAMASRFATDVKPNRFAILCDSSGFPQLRLRLWCCVAFLRTISRSRPRT